MSKINLLIIIFFTIIAHVIFYQTYKSFQSEILVLNDKVCLTKTCVKEAAKLLNTIDESVSPCDDFYQFSCGKWIQNNQLPEHKSVITLNSELVDQLNDKLKDLILKTDVKTESSDFVKKVKNFYDSCLNTTRIDELGDKPLRDVLNHLGGWPLTLQNYWNEVDWTDIYQKLKRLGDLSKAIISIEIQPDDQDNKKNIIIINQPSYGVGGRDSLLKPVNDSSIKAYKILMIKSALKLGAKADSVQSTVNEIFDFETIMAKNSMAKELRRNKTAISHKMTISNLSKLTQNINWMKIIGSHISQSITEYEEILLYDIQYITFLNEILPAYSNRFIKSVMFALDEEWLQLEQQYESVVYGTKGPVPRPEMCIEETKDSQSFALSHLYIKNFFNNEIKKKASELFRNVVKEFRKDLETNIWMGGQTQKAAIEKLDKMTFIVGYPDELMDESKVSNYLQPLKIDSSDYFGNNLRINKFINDMEFSKLKKTNDKLDWKDLTSVADVNAYHYYKLNLVLMPAAVLQGIYYNKDRPNYLNYGSIGSTASHEIIHGFDDNGKQYDANGNLKNWWHNKTDQLYTSKAKCFIDQYNNYRIKEINQNLNGVNTQGENIADNGGINLCYKAYVNYIKQNGPEPMLPALNYTPEQLFWISSAIKSCCKSTKEFLKHQVLGWRHSPYKPRVNCVVSNSADFSRAFNCPLGSPMNPKNKCNIW